MKINKIITFLIIPLVLIGVWVTLSILFTSEFSLSSLTYPHSSSDVLQTPEGKLLKGKKITGEFTAKDNNIGIIILRFKSFVRYDYAGEDVLVFKIKEKGQKDWSFISVYKAGILENKLNFPFGFPIISNSQGKMYEFEIESQNGNEKNAIELNTNTPTFSTVYLYPKEEITASKKRMLAFGLKKTYTSFTNPDFLLQSSIFLIPLALYCVFMVYRSKYKAPEKFVAISVLTLIFLDIFFIKETYTGMWIIFFISWIVASRMCKLSSSVTFALGIGCIFFWIVLLAFDMPEIEKKINLWAYTFLAIGVVQAALEEKNTKKKYITLKEFVKNFFSSK